MLALADVVISPPLQGRPCKQSFLWLAFLVPFFFSTYLGSLEIVSWRDHVPDIVFNWERHILFLAWTIIPYWSIDGLYGIALFLSPTRDELWTLGLRLLTARVIARIIFVDAPLRLTSVIPADIGAFEYFDGALGEVITKPFDMAPSLHIGLLVILWTAYARCLPRRWHWLVHIWSVLIGLSVMMAFQQWSDGEVRPLGVRIAEARKLRQRQGLAAGAILIIALGAVLRELGS